MESGKRKVESRKRKGSGKGSGKVHHGLAWIKRVNFDINTKELRTKSEERRTKNEELRTKSRKL